VSVITVETQLRNHVIVGTAGHIDHGKSCLVEALTGTHPDRLEEEKRRGITIDLGFAFLQLEEVCFGFVDVPGHERFVRNMLAGAGGVDILLLVIAADESIKPQTREHFDICRLLGISRGIIVLTKTDLAGLDLTELARIEVGDFCRGSFLEDAPIVEVSSRTGAGLDNLKAELLRAARDVPARNPNQYFRLPVDRAFAMKGFGTVVTGTLLSGSVAPDEIVEIFPAGCRVRVRGVHSGGHAVARASAGQRTAVNLAGVELADVERGMVLATPGRFHTTNRLDARLMLLSSARPLKNHARVHFHQGTAETIAEIVLLERTDNPGSEHHHLPGASALVQLRLKDPLLLLPGDRFVIRQYSPVITIGGGAVLDAWASRHRRGSPTVRAYLETLESGKPEDVLVANANAHPAGLELSEIIVRTGWIEYGIRLAAESLSWKRTIRIASHQPFVIVASTAYDNLTLALQQEVDLFHQENPLAPGLSKEELRVRFARMARPEVFRAALDALIEAGKLSLSGDLLARAGRVTTLLPDEALARDIMAREFERAGLAVPHIEETLKNLPVEQKRARKLLQLLLREKVLVRISEDLVFHGAAIAHLRDLLTGYKQAHGERISVPVFKDLTGVTRKYAIPLLEYLDRERLTRRLGDERVIL